ncbi:DNA dependent ATPase [Coprinopsis marcescibilis]|uniref:DNA dependent ATPase n=1 Tax=Coprinopsis marcescibilis TaxID=230819 RepID=A0A5C3KVE5_COPMA|nr:DNA dependent ATPase [Coprinopsis marcescibilis]
MSRGPANANNIRGPTSALTDFLRAGITHAFIARRRAATQQAPQQAAQQDNAQAGSSNAQNTSQQASASGSSSRPSRAASRRTSGYNSDNLDEEDNDAPMDLDDEDTKETIPTPAPKKRKLTKAAEAKLKTEAKKKAKGKKGSDDEYEDEDDDPYTSLSKSMWTNAGPKPPAGSFADCAKCGKQFTVTKYTLAANPPPGWLCHLCAKSSGQDPFKKSAAPKKRKAPADKREVIHFIENRLPTLVNICIKLLTKHIDDVESLGDIGTLNFEAISKAMSKNRSLTTENAKLFYNATNSRLTFHDATNLSPTAFQTLAYLNSNLTSLRLDFCGQIDDSSFKAFTTSLPALKRIELLGPFLVRVPAWKAFFKAHPDLEGFLITQSPRFDLDCIRTLVKHCPNLTELRLKEVGKMSDLFLEEIANLGEGLTYLDISCPGKESCSEAAIVGLLSEIGGSLKNLDVTKHDLFSRQFLMDGLLPNVKTLEILNMSHLVELLDEDVAEFFAEWTNSPLVQLELSRIPELKGEALGSIMKHSGNALELLNINGWKDVEEDALKTIGRLGKELKKLDVGFCRAVDDFLIKSWLEGEETSSGAQGVGV